MIYALGSAHESSASESKQSRSKVKILAARARSRWAGKATDTFQIEWAFLID